MQDKRIINLELFTVVTRVDNSNTIIIDSRVNVGGEGGLGFEGLPSLKSKGIEIVDGINDLVLYRNPLQTTTYSLSFFRANVLTIICTL